MTILWPRVALIAGPAESDAADREHHAEPADRLATVSQARGWQKTGSFGAWRAEQDRIAQPGRARGRPDHRFGRQPCPGAGLGRRHRRAENCTVVMPQTAPATRSTATQGYGGTVVLGLRALTVIAGRRVSRPVLWPHVRAAVRRPGDRCWASNGRPRDR